MSWPVVEARSAATVVLLRPGRAGLEALLTRRPSTMSFAPGMDVFPGGSVDPDDADPTLAARSMVSAADCATALGGDLPPREALAAHVAAIRELFEEAGVLLADAGRDGASVPTRAVTQARSALVGGEASFPSLVSELGLRLRTDWLVALSRWVTPPIMPRRFDTRFFAALFPPGARVSFEGNEVESHAWRTPAAALRALASGVIEMWVPTSATLQQLEHVASIDEIRIHLSPGRLGEIGTEGVSPEVTRITMPAGGGVAGQPVCAYLVGRRRFVLVDPGDPTGPAVARAQALAESLGGAIAAVALTHADPDHAGGAEAVAMQLAVPILAGPGAGGPLPYQVTELADGARVARCDVPMQALSTPGPRPDHLAFLVGDPPEFVISGDLDGRRGLRCVPGPADAAAWAAARERLAILAPGASWLSGHPMPSAERSG